MSRESDHKQTAVASRHLITHKAQFPDPSFPAALGVCSIARDKVKESEDHFNLQYGEDTLSAPCLALVLYSSQDPYKSTWYL